jgi:hypothetical protein
VTTSKDPLLAKNSIFNAAASTGLAGVWAKMDTGPLVAKSFMFDMSGLMPDYGKLMEPLALQLSRNVAGFMAAAYPMEQLNSIQKMIIDASGVNSISKMFMHSHDKMLRGMFPPMNVITGLGLTDPLQSSIGAITKSLATSLDTSYLNSILADAVKFSAQLPDQDFEELSEEFFENQPDLVKSIEAIPALQVPSTSDRRLIVWFVGIIVTLYVGNALLHVGTDFPEVKAMIDAFGLDAGGGVPAGLAAAAATNKALEKLSQQESE